MNKRFDFGMERQTGPTHTHTHTWKTSRIAKREYNSYVNLDKFDYDMLHMNMAGLKLKLNLN